MASSNNPKGNWGPEPLVPFFEALQKTKTLEKKFTLQGRKPASLGRIIDSFNKNWATIQCENCHGAAGEHPFSGNYTKTVKNQVCLACHTTHRSPKWYRKDGQPNLKLIAAKMKKVACPATDSP